MTKPVLSCINRDEDCRGRRPGEDDCWNHIGISGDRSCPELSSYVHCRNCPVFAIAARRFFDRPAPEGYLAEWSRWLADPPDQKTHDEHNGEREQAHQHHEGGLSFLVFRLGPEWLALRTQTVSEVTTSRPIHRVPHRTNQVFLGLVNLRGEIHLCFSLHGLLGITVPPSSKLLILLRDHEEAKAWAFAADEVAGVQHAPRNRWQAVPTTLVNPSVGFSQAVWSWKGRSVGLLDELRIFTALRSFGL
jgi:chemotaxis-related protein WspD